MQFVGTSSLIELLYGRKGVKTRMNDARFYSDATKAYDLVIKEMTYDLAGVYICKVRDTATKTATATANIMAIGRFIGVNYGRGGRGGGRGRKGEREGRGA